MNFGRAKAAKWLVAALVCGFFLPIQTAPAHAAVIGDTDQALVLNGTNQNAQVSDPGASVFDSTGTVTIEAWVYPTSACNSGDQGIATKDVSYMLYCKSGVYAYAYSSDGTSWSGVTTSVKVAPNEWHHVALSHAYGSTNAKFYYDGVNVETETTNVYTSLTPNNNPFRIGTYGGGNFFQGKLDEVRIYNSARSDSQVPIDMNNYGPVNDVNLIAYYDFNDETGSTIANADSSPAPNTNLTTYFSPTYANVESTSVVNGDQVITFPRTYLTANGGWRIPSYVSTVQSLVIAGGGAGGSRAGGGGGAGGYVYDNALSVSPNSIQSIVVGQGGYAFVAQVPTNGLNSSLGSLRSTLGGGGGGFAALSNNTVRAGHDGGSGGGASGDWQTIGSSAAYGLTKQNSTYGYGVGFSGGSGYTGGGSDNTPWPTGGGGGAGGAGANAVGSTGTAGKGGTGLSDPIGGTTKCFATGGGGGVYYTYTGKNGAGGDCGGTASPNGNAGGVGSATLTPATANTGSGGGGNGYSSGADAAGGNGASGVIILRYPLNMSVSVSFSGGTSATYRTAGTITATTTLAGKVTFYDHGKAIPGCKNVATNGSNIATCTWKPSLHGATTVTATAKPSNTYVSNGSGYLNLTVGARGTTR